jgi:hypothetical protein
MAYFLFSKDSDNINGTLYRIYENQNDLNNSNINQNVYKIIEDSQENFNLCKFGNKLPISYNNNNIVYENINAVFLSKEHLLNYINNIKNNINDFINNNPNHPSLSIWKNYYNQINNLNLDSITYPLNKSLEQYFNDLGQPSFNILQLP